MAIYGTIGAKALYLLFLWLISAAAAAWMAERKGYGERLGLTFGLILSVIGLVIVLLLPGRPGSAWKIDGPLPRRGSGPGSGPGGPGSEGPSLGPGPEGPPVGPGPTPPSPAPPSA
ncbi:MAG: hypothetical protein WBQ18_21285 [Solirubrobacteraceae bacterium]